VRDRLLIKSAIARHGTKRIEISNGDSMSYSYVSTSWATWRLSRQ